MIKIGDSIKVIKCTDHCDEHLIDGVCEYWGSVVTVNKVYPWGAVCVTMLDGYDCEIEFENLVAQTTLKDQFEGILGN